MTKTVTPSAIFTGLPKLIVAGADASVMKLLEETLSFAVIPVRRAPEGSLLAITPETEVPLGAPPAGLTVIAYTATAAANADALTELWRAAGLPVPTAVLLPDSAADPAAPLAAAAIANAFATAALAAQKEACTEAVLLDRQIAALRDQLEDSRNKWRDCASALKAATQGLPLLGYATREFSGRMKVSPDAVLSQQLPYAGVYCKAAAIHIAAPARGPGRLEGRLLTVEDGVELARWERVAVNREGWRLLDLPTNIPWRYRNLRLVLTWHGEDTAAPELSLARAAGMDRHFLHLDATPQDGARLALRVWTGDPDSPPPAGGTPPSALQAHPVGERGQPVEPALLNRHVKLVERSLGDWPWVDVRKQAILVHPTLAGPSVIGLPLEDANGLTGIHVTCDSPLETAPPIEFLAAAFPADTALTLDSHHPDPLPRHAALAVDGWQELPPGSSLPLTLELKPQAAPVQLVLATRVRGKSVDSAHGWFRDIRLVFSD